MGLTHSPTSLVKYSALGPSRPPAPLIRNSLEAVQQLVNAAAASACGTRFGSWVRRIYHEDNGQAIKNLSLPVQTSAQLSSRMQVHAGRGQRRAIQHQQEIEKPSSFYRLDLVMQVQPITSKYTLMVRCEILLIRRTRSDTR